MCDQGVAVVGSRVFRWGFYVPFDRPVAKNFAASFILLHLHLNLEFCISMFAILCSYLCN